MENKITNKIPLSRHSRITQRKLKNISAFMDKHYYYYHHHPHSLVKKFTGIWRLKRQNKK